MIETIKMIKDIMSTATTTFTKAKKFLDTPDQINEIGNQLEQLRTAFENIRQSEQEISKVIDSVEQKATESFGNNNIHGNNNSVQQGKNINIGNNVSGGSFTIGNITL